STAFMSVCFSLALSLSSYTQIPLSTGMCIILPHIMEYNLTTSTGKYVQIAKVMDENVREITVIEAAIKAVEAIRKVTSDIDIPQRLSEYEVSKTLFNKISSVALTYPFIKHSPRTLSRDELETILIAAF
ncbi:MAG: iron-containing alcohol dehydrogenase, partial [Spirochaetota bacterium]